MNVKSVNESIELKEEIPTVEEENQLSQTE
jgi:hypothetical protein